MDGTVTIHHAPRHGRHVRRAGEDIRQGAIVLSRGAVLGAGALGLAASLGLVELPVYRRLKAAMFFTGDELVRPGKPLRPGEIYGSNDCTLGALLARFGCQVINVGYVPDCPDLTAAVLDDAAAMLGTFQPLLEQGYDVLGIFLSSKFSGTIQSAMQACGMLDGAAKRVAIVDSLSTTMAMGWPVLTAARAAQVGETLAECQKIAESACQNSGVLFVVETLEFLRRGGRIGGAAALLGTALNIKPVLEMRDGRIESVEKIRTRHKATQRMIELAAGCINTRTPVRVAVSHANSEADALSLLEAVRGQLDPVETYCCPLSPVIGTHTGPGTVALNFMAGIT